MTDSRDATPKGPAQTATAPGGTGRLDALMAAASAAGGRGPAPLERWNPPDCGDIDMRIAADGTWFYAGTPIGRPALVRLFASVLTREDGRFVLKTPAEKVGLSVEDAPFLAVDFAEEETKAGKVLVFRTNLDDIVRCGPGHDLRFAPGAGVGEVRPYLHVRRGLEARLTRAAFVDLVERGEVRDLEGVPMFGIASGGCFYPMMAADELDRAST
ncbi:MAG: hypothetical protein B7Y95_24190 [Rhizobiales bacterium 32-66-11]|nr:MAG: hypothetical protein B7Y95_24190 [Rhizobiales bacterium 32-66-11]